MNLHLNLLDYLLIMCEVFPHPPNRLKSKIFFTNSNLAVMGLAETKLTNKAAQHMFCSTNFRFFYNNNSTSPLSQGVGLLIDNNYAKFIQKSGGFKGRILYVDMFLKGRIKLRIIQVSTRKFPLGV